MTIKSCVVAALSILSCTVSVPVVAESNTHKMVTPADLTWTDVASLPPGAKLAVIEGPMNEAVPFTVRI